MTPAEREACWREYPLDAIALIRADLTRDIEGMRVIAEYAELEPVLAWLVAFAGVWLLEWAGIRCHPDGFEVERAALAYLDELTAGWTDGMAA